MAAVPPLSYSSIHTYEECPLRWKFLYVDRLPERPRGYFTFGRTIHSVLEEMLRPYLRPPPKVRPGSRKSQTSLWEFDRSAEPVPGDVRGWSEAEVLSAYDRHWSGEGYGSPDEEQRYRELGRQILLGYWRHLRAQPPTPIAVESHLEARWDGLPIHGYVDRIDMTRTGGLAILDYKTSREVSLADAERSDQLTLYQVLVEQNFSQPVETLALVHLRSLTPRATSPRPRSVLEELRERVGEAADGIRSGRFEPTPGPACARCDFRALCPEFRSLPPAEEQRLRLLVDQLEALRWEEARIDRALRSTAEELHTAAERYGIHRIPGSRSVAIRKSDLRWWLSPSSGPPNGERAPIDPRGLPADLRKSLAPRARQDLRWYWELEDGRNDRSGA